ncbi:DUF4145 domain-containing protein [Rhodococcus pyridinivorans]
MSGINKDLYVSSDCYDRLESNDARSWVRLDCAHCTGTQMIVVANTSLYSETPEVYWLRCVNCGLGTVVNVGTQSPSQCPLDVPDGLPNADYEAWDEVRSCLQAGAYTAAVMMCRKLLFHIAVAHDLPPKNEKNRAPSFAQCLDHLELEGIITKPMRRWVDRIKDVGNEANHELTGYKRDQAMDIAKFTKQLLHMAYELPMLVGSNDEA